ncbi:MAG: hypothetical protein II208_04000 [Alphaproteobacteria bacterium]|nr:hypothetical protein [Alphaproteobacteria bacterium]
MAKKDNFVLIKTKEDFKKAYNEYLNMDFRVAGKQYALAPDFDDDLIWIQEPENYLNIYATFISELIRNTEEISTRAQMVEYFNKMMRSFRETLVYRAAFTGINPESIRKVVGTGQRNDNSVRKFLQPFVYGSGIIFDKKDKDTFNKGVLPDSQVLFNMTNIYSPLHYNFSGARLQDSHVASMALPKENQPNFTRDERVLQEKYNQDFNKHLVDVKKLFPGAKNPQLLYHLRRGKINPRTAMLDMDKDDYKFIVPSQDFIALEPYSLYEFMSKPGLNWSPFQVRSIMTMIVDKAEPTKAWLADILKVINTNKHIFLTQPTDDNFKLWVKIESKFADVIKSEKDYVAGIKKELEVARANKIKRSDELVILVPQEQELRKEMNEFRDIERRLSALAQVPDNNGYFKKHAVDLLTKLEQFKKTGEGIKVEIPEKPWRLFAFDKEKKLYENLVYLVDRFNKFVSTSIEDRINLFGEHRFNFTDKYYMIEKKIKQADEHLIIDSKTVEKYSDIDSYNPGVVVDARITEQKHAKQNRFENARKKMQEKGFVPGQKSGVVLVDKKIRDDKIKAKLEQLKKSGKYENVPPEKLLEIATKIVVGKRK